MKKRILFICLTAIGVAVIATGAARVLNDLEQQEITIERQDNLLHEMESHLTEQAARIRVMAYHQAVAQLEQQYPAGSRDHIPALKWEQMLAERTENIMIQFYEEHGN